MSFLEGGQAAGELEQSEVVLGLLAPANQNSAVAVKPRVAGLDNPAARLLSGFLHLERGLLAASTDVCGQPMVGDDPTGLGGVVGFVEADALRGVCGRLGTRDRDRVERLFEELQVVAVGAGVREPDRDSRGLRENRTFRPPLALSVGFGPVLGPPSGALVIAPSAQSQAQSMPTSASYSKSPWRQISWKHPRSFPLLEAPVRGA